MKPEKAPIFFKGPEEFRNWLIANHSGHTELWVGYYKKASGIPSITWPESVDQALCFGWIDGIRKSIDEVSYKIRFTPRKPDSHWSDVNINKVNKLKKEGLMTPTGLAAFKRREEKRSRKASYEQKNVSFNKNYERKFKKSKIAWNYFCEQPPSYKKQSIWWIMSAKREDTQLKRLDTLISSSAKKEWIPPLKWTRK